IKAKHPAHYKRDSSARYRQYEVSEILADFIIRAEDDASGLTASPQTQETRNNRINERETLTDFTDRFNDDVQAEDKPAGWLSEYDVYQQRGELYPDFTEEVEPEISVDEFKATINRIKDNAKEYAGKYSEKYGKDYKETLKRIRKLDNNRVAICEECGDVYYKHDMRRMYCDLRPSCEINAKRR